ncbi:MAG TPA: ParB/RepB/Spo0J family partition protein [Terriglobales bacterium]|nr:ParB/RepB/Spo0J family partition protein [Terriglobales bacterium]
MTVQTTDKRKALGRGLDSLLPKKAATPAAPAAPAPGASPAPAAAAAPGEAVEQIPLELIEHNPYQTRSYMPEHSLVELTDSIKAAGVIEPIIVRKAPGGRYHIIAGERRYAASKRAGKKTVPAVVVQVSNEQAMEMTIIENLQREDLNALDQATAYDRLSREFNLTQEEMAQKTGKPRSEVANYLRLLKLPGAVKMGVQQGAISFSHAKVLMSLDDPNLIIKVATKMVKDALSVRQLEDLCFEVKHPIEKAKAAAKYVDPNVREAEKELERALGVRVRIKDKRGKGKIVIEYASLEDFDRVVEKLSKK